MPSNSILPENDLQKEVAVDVMVFSEAHRLLSVQSKQTRKNFDNLISDNKKRAEEIQALKQSSKGYPSKQELANLTFYTGFECFTVLMLVFEFVSKVIIIQITTIMKLWLNLNHYDLAFQFGICQTTA